MSTYKSINSTNRHSFQVNKTWKLNQSSAELLRYSYKSGSTWKNDEYHTLSDTPAAISESYWHSLSFNFYNSASHFEGFSPLTQNVKKSGVEHKNKLDQGIDYGKLKWLNPYHSLAQYAYLSPTSFPINLNKFGKNWIQGNVISVSQGIYGEYIKPGSVTLVDNSTPQRLELRDDSYGNLYAVNPILSQSNNSPSSSINHVGNVFYDHGLIVLKETSSFSASCAYTKVSTGQFNLTLQSTNTINTVEYTCVLQPTEFMTTTNPTAGDYSGSLATNIDIEGNWSPYMTTVGLYDAEEHLVMVARLSQPIKRSKKLPLTIKLIHDY